MVIEKEITEKVCTVEKDENYKPLNLKKLRMYPRNSFMKKEREEQVVPKKIAVTENKSKKCSSHNSFGLNQGSFMFGRLTPRNLWKNSENKDRP